MMMVQRFRSLGWVAMIAACAMAFYLISLQVASERAALEKVEHRIVETRRDIRRLQTELVARGSMRQLERWNGEVLALVTPEAGQFLPDDGALARVSFDTARLPPPGTPNAMLAAAQREPSPSASPSPAPEPKAEFRRAVAGDVEALPLPREPARNAGPGPALRLASLNRPLLDEAVIKEIASVAERERRTRP